jgi:galactokinase
MRRDTAMPHDLAFAARSALASAFGGEPSILAVAPSRVELLGNHTDYNGGLVLAAAIDRFTVVAGRPIAGREGRVVAANFDGQTDRFDLATVGSESPRPEGWVRYVRGVAWAVQRGYGPLRSGFEVAIAGNVPLGAGLSSSASLQAALAMFLFEAGLAGDRVLDDPARMALAQVLKTSENDYVGVASGLLDQFSVLFGRANHALLLDCRSGDYERVPLGNPAPAIVVCDSKTSRRLADGMYNQRREECERIVAYFQPLRGSRVVTQLRDISVEELHAEWKNLDPFGKARARHVLTENDRVRRGAEALKAGEIAKFGKLMSASHASSRDDFRNSSVALDALVESAEESPGFLGGKLSGAGWAGCTVNLVEPDKTDAFAASVREEYARRMGIEPAVHVCRAADGASASTVATSRD